MKLGEVLLKKKVLSEEQLQQLIAEQPTSRKKLGELLVERSLISDRDLDQALQEQYWRRHGFWVIG